MRKTFWLYILLSLAATILVGSNPFFWDTVQLASKHGQFFYDNDFSSLILPADIDSGHVPAFGMYIAFCWKIFGQSLAVSHFAMLPFLWGIGYFILKTGAFLAGEKKAAWLLVLCFADPVLAAQSVLVSPDVALICFFLMGLYAVWIRQAPWLLMLAVAGLGLTSMRGMMVGIGLFGFSFFIVGEKWDMRHFITKLLPFIPGGLLAIAFLFYHWYQTGWIGYHPDSPWAPSYERVDMSGFAKNVAVLGWRLLDFGRVFVWLSLLVLGIGWLKRIKKQGPVNSKGENYFGLLFGMDEASNRCWRLVVLAIIIFVATIPTQLLYKGLLAHRYFLPFFVVLHLLVFQLIFRIDQWRVPRRWLLFVIILGMLTGNFWIYPKKISQGWDSTLAHLHWYGQIADVQIFLQQENISYQKVGTAFPNIGPRKWYELNKLEDGFKEKDLQRDCFILYSNIMNDFSDEEIDQLEADWLVIYQQEQMGVGLILYQNPNSELCEN